jgi:SIR2-like domain
MQQTPDDDHYWLVASEILDGTVVPFLGAGANLCGRPPQAAWERGRYLPSGAELAEALAGRWRYPEPEQSRDLLRVSQYVDAVVGARRLYQYLRALFDADYPPTALHHMLAQVPRVLRERGVSQQLILTTNYDDALERAFVAAGEAYDLIWYEAKECRDHGRFIHVAPSADAVVIDVPNEYDALSLDERPVILKLHGEINRLDERRDSYVITEDDYIEYLANGDISSQIPVLLREHMSDSHYLFLGYSLRDWNLRVILNRIWGQQQLDVQSWAIQRPPDGKGGEIEQKLWARRGEVELLYGTLEEYVVKLSAQLFPAGETAASSGTGAVP